MCDPDCGSGDDVRYEGGGGDAGSGEKESGWRGGVGGSTGIVLSDGHGSECRGGSGGGKGGGGDC